MRRMIRFGPLQVAALVATLFAMVLAATASGVTQVTIGQTSAAAGYQCGSGYGPNTPEYDLQTSVASGTGFIVPAGNWAITSWSTYAGNPGGSMSMIVFQPAGVTDTYTVVAESPVESLTAGVLNTFPANVLVQQGDLLGFWSTGNAACLTMTGAAGDVNPSTPGPEPAVGSTIVASGFPGYLLNISAALTLLPTTKDQCKNGAWQGFSVFKNQGDCVSYVATGGNNLPALSS